MFSSVRIVAAIRFVSPGLESVIEFQFCLFGYWNQMAAAAALKRVGQLGINSGISLTGFGGFGIGASKNFPSFSSSKHFSHMVKPNGQHLFLVDTLALVIHITFSYYFLFMSLVLVTS